MEKKVEVEIRGHKIMVAEHMLEDLARFGITTGRRNIRDIPRELLNMPEPKRVILPGKPIEVPVIPVEVPVKTIEVIPTPVIEPVIEPVIKTKAVRKTPVKSKAKK
jgi:hypothetical protein